MDKLSQITYVFTFSSYNFSKTRFILIRWKYIIKHTRDILRTTSNICTQRKTRTQNKINTNPKLNANNQHTRPISRPNVMRFSFVMNDKYLIHASVCQCVYMINHNSMIVACVCHWWEWDGWNRRKKQKQKQERVRIRWISKRAKNEKRMKKNMRLTNCECVCVMVQAHIHSWKYFWALELELCLHAQTTKRIVHMQLYK